jgi:hypothetical protein
MNSLLLKANLAIGRCAAAVAVLGAGNFTARRIWQLAVATRSKRAKDAQMPELACTIGERDSRRSHRNDGCHMTSHSGTAWRRRWRCRAKGRNGHSRQEKNQISLATAALGDHCIAEAAGKGMGASVVIVDRSASSPASAPTTGKANTDALVGEDRAHTALQQGADERGPFE